MNVTTIKLICWLAALSSAGGLAKYAFDWFDTIEQRQVPVDQAYVEKVLSEDVVVAVNVEEIVAYEDLKVTFSEMSWSGKPPKKVIVDTTPKEPTGPRYVPMDQVLAISMLAFDTDNPGGSWADVTYKKENQPAILKVGQVLDSPYDYAVVYRIHSGTIEFTFKDSERDNESIGAAALEEELIVQPGPGGPITRRQDPVPSGSAKDRRQETEQFGDTFLLGEQDMNTFSTDYQRILTEDVTTRTYMKDGKRAGVEIQSVKTGSIAAKHGAMEGDVIISINGKKVTSESEAISFVKSNSDKYDTWEVVVLRFGKEETVVYHSDQ